MTGGNGILIEKEAEPKLLFPLSRPVLVVMAAEGYALGSTVDKGLTDNLALEW